MLLFFHCPLEPLDSTSKPFLCCLRLLEHFNAVTSLIIRLSESCSRSKKLMHQLSEVLVYPKKLWLSIPPVFPQCVSED